MNSYILILVADILLAATLAFQKKYQAKVGATLKTSLVYSIISGIFSSAIFLFINNFSLRVTWFSAFMAMLFSVVLVIYVFAGFRIMEQGNVSIYTLFLMSGGMIVPYIYGVLFLNESLTLVRIIGLFLIIGAIVVANFTRDKINTEQLVLCIVVFLLNGLASVISKAHQVSAASRVVSSSDFVFLVMISKIFVSILALLLKRDKETTDEKLIVHFKPVVLIIFFAAAADGTSYMLQLMGAVNLPATVLYPLVTGGTIVLSSLVDFVIYKEKLSVKQCIGTVIAFIGTFMFL